MSLWVLGNAKNLVQSRKEHDKSQRDATRLQERVKSLLMKCAHWGLIEYFHAFKLSSRYQATSLSMRWIAGVIRITSPDLRLHHSHHTWEFKIQDPDRQSQDMGGLRATRTRDEEPVRPAVKLEDAHSASSRKIGLTFARRRWTVKVLRTRFVRHQDISV